MKNEVTMEKARALFKKSGGILRTGEAMNLGIHSKTLYRMQERGDIRAIDRGIYLLVDEEIGIFKL